MPFMDAVRDMEYAILQKGTKSEPDTEIILTCDSQKTIIKQCTLTSGFIFCFVSSETGKQLLVTQASRPHLSVEGN